MEKKFDGNYTRMLQAILNKSWRQQPTNQQLYGHLPSTTKTIQVRRTRHVGHGWRSRDELIREVFLWTHSYGREKAGQPARTNIQQLCVYAGCSFEDRRAGMGDREGWRERVRDYPCWRRNEIIMPVGHDGPATMGLNLRPLGFGITIYSVLCFYGVFYLLGLVNF